MKKNIIKNPTARSFNLDKRSPNLEGRVISVIFDLILMVPLTFIIILPFKAIATEINSKDYLYYILIFVTIFIIYNTVCESSKFMGTVGHSLFRLKVTTRDYKRLSFGRAFLRSIVKLFFYPLLLSFYIIGTFMTYIVIPIYDKLAGVVVTKKSATDEDIIEM